MLFNCIIQLKFEELKDQIQLKCRIRKKPECEGEHVLWSHHKRPCVEVPGKDNKKEEAKPAVSATVGSWMGKMHM